MARNEIANFVRAKYPLSDLDPGRFALVPGRKDFYQVAKSMPVLWTAMRLLTLRDDRIIIARDLSRFELFKKTELAFAKGPERETRGGTAA